MDRNDKRKQVPVKLRAQLQREIDSKCPFCPNTDVGHFEVHHINSIRSDNSLDNLLLLCPTCHSKITKGDITEDTVKSKKRLLKLKAEIRQLQNSLNDWSAEIKEAVYQYMLVEFTKSIPLEERTPSNLQTLKSAIACLVGKIASAMSTEAFVNMTNYEREYYCTPLLKQCLRENGVEIN